MTGVLLVEKPGAATIVCAGPVRGRAHQGHSIGGAFDARSLALANLCVGNPIDAPALECVLLGPTLRAIAPCTVAWCGAPFQGPAPLVPVTLAVGDRLSWPQPSRGLRATIAVTGGVNTPGTGAVLRAGETIGVGSMAGVPRALSPTLLPTLDEPTLLRVTAGLDASLLGGAFDALCGRDWRVLPESSRRGVRLGGEPLAMAPAPERSSTGVTAGTVQVPPGGLPIVLGVDQTTTGGYPQLAHVIEADLWKLGQLRPGARVRFGSVDFEEARTAWRQWSEMLSGLR